MAEHKLTIRMETALRDGLKRMADENNRSMNGQVVEVLQKAIDNHPIPKPN